ncbi:hypothetical protein ACOMHN_040276 [Nucella lapillus]
MARLAVGTMARLAVRAFSLPHPSHPGGATGEDHRWHQERGWTPQETGRIRLLAGLYVPGQKRVVRKETGVTVDSTQATRVERPNSRRMNRH